MSAEEAAVQELLIKSMTFSVNPAEVTPLHGVILSCFRSCILQQDRTPTPRRSPAATQDSGKRVRRSATVNPESPDSPASRDQKYRLVSLQHTEFILSTQTPADSDRCVTLCQIRSISLSVVSCQGSRGLQGKAGTPGTQGREVKLYHSTTTRDSCVFRCSNSTIFFVFRVIKELKVFEDEEETPDQW